MDFGTLARLGARARDEVYGEPLVCRWFGACPGSCTGMPNGTDGCGEIECAAYEPMPDVEALREIAEEIDVMGAREANASANASANRIARAIGESLGEIAP